MPDDQFTLLPIDSLTEPWTLLRPVLHDSISYLELKTSMDENGLINSIAVRPSERKPGFYEIIDGMWRVTVARELDFTEIPAIVKQDVTDGEVLTLQIQANAIRPETRPIEFAKQLRKIQKLNDGITLRSLSSMLNKNPAWIQNQLGLLHLDKLTQRAIDRGEISLCNAYMLVKIAPKIRPDYIDSAKVMSGVKFKALAAGVIKQYKEAVRQGKLDAFFTEDFEVQPFLRSLKEIQSEVDSRIEAPLVITTENCTTPLDGWMAALKWALHIDTGGQKQQEMDARAKSRKRWGGN